MAYATIDDIFGRYAPIHTMVGSGKNDVTSSEVSSIFIADAESFVNAYLGKRYIVPVSPEPIITQLTSDLAIAQMMLDKLGELPDFMQNRYDRATSNLEMLRDGDMVLTAGSTQVVTSGDQFAWSTTEEYHSTFSPVLDELDQQVDRDWVRDDRDVRRGDGPVGDDYC